MHVPFTRIALVLAGALPAALGACAEKSAVTFVATQGEVGAVVPVEEDDARLKSGLPGVRVEARRSDGNTLVASGETAENGRLALDLSDRGMLYSAWTVTATRAGSMPVKATIAAPGRSGRTYLIVLKPAAGTR